MWGGGERSGVIREGAMNKGDKVVDLQYTMQKGKAGRTQKSQESF